MSLGSEGIDEDRDKLRSMDVIFRFVCTFVIASFDFFKMGIGGTVVFDGLEVSGATIALRDAVANETISNRGNQIISIQ